MASFDLLEKSLQNLRLSDDCSGKVIKNINVDIEWINCLVRLNFGGKRINLSTQM